MQGVDRKLELFRVLNALPPGATVSAGDKVKIVEFRPLSRNKRWHLVSILEKAV